MIFSRGRGGGRHQRGDARTGQPGPAARGAGDPARPAHGGDAGRAGDAWADDAWGEAGGQAVPFGPYDVTEAPDDLPRLDLGALRIPAVEGVEVRVQADPDGTVQQVVLVHEANALQLGVFAAPRSEGIWDEVRDEIRQSLFDDGVAAEEAAGDYGVELRARVRTPDGLTDLRFVGVDGPRWMLRGVFQGPAAVDPSHAGPLLECLRGVVVDRGQQAMPVREPLPLRLPREMAEQAQLAQQAGPADAPRGVGRPGLGRQPGAGGADTAVPGPGPNGSGRWPDSSGPAPHPRRRPSPRPRHW